MAGLADLSPDDLAAMQPETYANPFVKRTLGDLATLPRRAIENSQHSLDTGTYDPGPTLEAAMLPMGTGAIAGVPVRAGETALGAGPIRAYHGSPHDFDRFDLSKIGTGEGAQAYGHGLYFAEREGVAKNYKDVLSQIKDTRPAHEQVASDAIERFGGRDAALNQLQDVVRSRESGINKPWGEYFPYHDEASLAVDLLKNPEWQPKKLGRMYEVNINADPAHFLDWDKPLKGHDPQTQDAIKRAMSIDYYGKPDLSKAEGLWNQFGNANTSTAVKQGFIASDDKLVADRLREQGIPGIKYLDQGSRAAGDGSRNYVVFDHNLIDIVRKYAAAGIALPPAIAAQYEQMKQSQGGQPNHFADGGITPQGSSMFNPWQQGQQGGFGGMMPGHFGGFGNDQNGPQTPQNGSPGGFGGFHPGMMPMNGMPPGMAPQGQGGGFGGLMDTLHQYSGDNGGGLSGLGDGGFGQSGQSPPMWDSPTTGQMPPPQQQPAIAQNPAPQQYAGQSQGALNAQNQYYAAHGITPPQEGGPPSVQALPQAPPNGQPGPQGTSAPLAFADGGGTPDEGGQPSAGLSGLITSPVAGRTDRLPMDVPPNSYVIPADIVSGLGQGNTLAGGRILDAMLKDGPHMQAAAAAPAGGQQNFADGGETGTTPIVTAGGEFVCSPDMVAALGGGDVNKGHKILDNMVLHVRKQTVQQIKDLPKPKK